MYTNIFVDRCSYTLIIIVNNHQWITSTFIIMYIFASLNMFVHHNNAPTHTHASCASHAKCIPDGPPWRRMTVHLAQNLQKLWGPQRLRLSISRPPQTCAMTKLREELPIQLRDRAMSCGWSTIHFKKSCRWWSLFDRIGQCHGWMNLCDCFRQKFYI